MHQKRSSKLLKIALLFVAVVALFNLKSADKGASLMNFNYAQAMDSSVRQMDIWWPAPDAKVSGLQPFKAMLAGRKAEDYRMFWRVDNGQWNWMDNNYQDYPHKEALVDLTNWKWRSDGRYMINFIATDWQGNKIAEKAVPIHVPQSESSAITDNQNNQNNPVQNNSDNSASKSGDSAANNSISVNSSADNPFQGAKLYVNSDSNAKKLADGWRSSRPADAALMDKIANQPEVKWIGNWNSDVYSDVKNFTDEITSKGALPIFVAYNIPMRDCGGYSGGGAGSAEAYKSWIRSFAQGIGNRKAAVILEPDALDNMDCLSQRDQETRLGLVRDAIQTFNSQGNISVYVDAGHPGWLSAGEIASRLKRAGIDQARGFSLNVSNFFTTEDNANYGKEVSSMTDGKHFIIDTGRNGFGPTPDRQWCNPLDRSLGKPPAADTGDSLVDAYLWVKNPGESDGQCNGAPVAGVFWLDYALGLAKRANW